MISLCAICLIGISCSKSDSPSKGKELTVSLKLGGDFSVDVGQDPLTKVGETPTDAYGINVYYDKEGDGQTNDIYAYGLFDNTADMNITLLSGHRYKVACNLVKDARNTLYYGQAFNNTYSGYAYPFQTTASNSTLINNKFIIGTSTYFNGFSSGNAHVATATTSPSTSNATAYPSVNRFYGETDQYEPVPNGTIDIYLKRVVFGAKFVVSGLQEGTATVTGGAFFSKTYSTNDEGTGKIYTFPNVYNAWKEGLPLVANVSVNYTSSRGSLWNLSQNQDIQFKRNVMTTVNIILNPDLSGATFNITEEELGEDNIIDLGINTDGLIDITVNPNN